MPSLACTRRRAGLRLAALAAAGAWSRAQAGGKSAPVGRLARAEVRAWLAETARRHDLDRAWLAAHLARAQTLPSVLQLITPSAQPAAKDWAAYRARFVDDERVAAGLAFWQANEQPLGAAQQRWGVPASVVLGIVGVETCYGRIVGRYRLIDALATHAFEVPRSPRDRRPYFRDELAAYFAWCRRDGLDPQALRGSYAGAVGLPQFMPASVLRYGVDFDEDGRVDLFASAPDAIGSIAHFLAAAGWQAQLPATYPVEPPPPGEALRELLAPDIVPTFTADALAARGARLADAARTSDGLLALVELRNGSAPPSHVAGTTNFFALTRYNRSSYYAMAVLELGAAVAAARGSTA